MDPLVPRAEALGLFPPSVDGPFDPWPQDGPVGDTLGQAAAAAWKLIANDRAPSTRAKYLAAWRRFVAWVARYRPEVEYLPARPALVGLYIGELERRGASTSHILVELAGLKYVHEVIGAPWLVDGDPMLKRQLRGLRRRPQTVTPKQALLQEQLLEVLARLGPPTTPFGLRDRAILTLTWCGALRRAETAALIRADLEFGMDPLDGVEYLRVRIRESKTGAGVTTILALPGQHPLCAVRAVRAWLAELDLASRTAPATPLFPSFTLAPDPANRTPTDRPISGQDVERCIRRTLRAALFPDETDEAKIRVALQAFGGHSLRRGFARSADRAGARRAEIRKQGRWADDRMLARYTELDENVRENAMRAMFGIGNRK
jgi:integrase